MPRGEKQHKLCGVPAEPYLHSVSLPATDTAKRLDGSYAGFQPKPAAEVILVAMKPFDEKSFTHQALANGKAVTWLDDCRIPYGDELPNIGDRHLQIAETATV